jgi:hypothetical protein
MGTVPAPNIVQDAGTIAQAPQNALAEYARVAALKQQTALQQQQTQGAALDVQQKQLDLKNQQIVSQIAPQHIVKDDSGKVTGYDWDGLAHDAMAKGASPQYVNGLQMNIAKARSDLANAGKLEMENQDAVSKKALGMHEDLKGITDPTQRQQAYGNLVGFMKSHNIDVSGYPAQVPMNNDDLTHLELPLGMHAQLLAETKTQAEAAEAAAKAQNEKAQAGLNEIKLKLAANSKPGDFDKQIDSIYDPNATQTGGPNRMIKTQVNAALQRGDIEGARKYIDQALEQQLSIQKDVAEKTNPAIQAAELHLATAKKAAEQAIADGDPRAAAQLLVSGVVSPSQLVSSRKPAFAQQAFTAAEQMNPGWNAQKAEADFKVAGSPANVAFFGSAKSLTDKGGTLDQLNDAAKDIPGHRLPVFNTVDDAIRASTGSGPIAKYAALALGVADDYSKVMGGGQGSDTSRTQALKIISANESREQRAGSIEGIRGAVASQTNSRIGNNAVLQKMYGESTPAAQPKKDFWSQFPEHK